MCGNARVMWMWWGKGCYDNIFCGILGYTYRIFGLGYRLRKRYMHKFHMRGIRDLLSLIWMSRRWERWWKVRGECASKVLREPTRGGW